MFPMVKLICFILLNSCLSLTAFAESNANGKTKPRKLNENVPYDLKFKIELWMSATKPGKVTDFAGGKLYRIDEGARFVDNMGIAVVIPEKKADYNYIAYKSPALARYWAEKYNFKPLPPDTEHDLTTETDDQISFFDSLNRAMEKLQKEEKEIRQKLSAHPAVIKDFSCVSYDGNAEVKTFCDQLIKCGMDHQELFKKIEKLKGELDTKSKNDLVISEEAKKFNRDFSPFIFKSH
jgi:hypothetical protein